MTTEEMTTKLEKITNVYNALSHAYNNANDTAETRARFSESLDHLISALYTLRSNVLEAFKADGHSHALKEVSRDTVNLIEGLSVLQGYLV